ncbi:MAG: NAD(P)-dependent oxidoreductase, partial [Planctomycetota bacterium]
MAGDGSNSEAAPLVLQTEDLDTEASAWLEARAQLVRCELVDPAFAVRLPMAEGLVVRTYTRIDRAMLERAPKLRVVGRAGVGLDNIDVAACRRRGVAVVHTPDANTRAVVEFVLACLLDATRPRVFLEGALDAGEWKRARRELIAERELAGRRLGVYGMGRVGSQVARAAAALDMDVVYHDLREIQPEHRHGATPVSRETLLETSDVVTVHVDGRSENRGLINADAFARMMDDVLFLNTSRGFVVEAHALASCMIEHPGAQAVLDVHDPEPFGPTYPLLDIENVHLTPHIASGTRAAKRSMSWVVRDVWRVLSGEAPRHPAPGPDSGPAPGPGS